MNWRKGFTLIELLIVVTILAVLAGAAIPYVADYVEDARYAKAKADVDEIKNALTLYETRRAEMYLTDSGAGLVDAGYLIKLPIDPWGAPYVVATGSGEVYSMGPDGTGKTGDDIKTTYQPVLALRSAYWWDFDNTSTVTDADRLYVTFSRPIKTAATLLGSPVWTGAGVAFSDGLSTADGWGQVDIWGKIKYITFSNAEFVPGKTTITLTAPADFVDNGDPAISLKSTGESTCKNDTIKILAR